MRSKSLVNPSGSGKSSEKHGDSTTDGGKHGMNNYMEQPPVRHQVKQLD
jgi:hypothetical protein